MLNKMENYEIYFEFTYLHAVFIVGSIFTYMVDLILGKFIYHLQNISFIDIKYRIVILGQILYIYIFFRLNRSNNIFSRRCMARRRRRLLVLLYHNLSSPTTNYCCPSIFFKMASNG